MKKDKFKKKYNFERKWLQIIFKAKIVFENVIKVDIHIHNWDVFLIICGCCLLLIFCLNIIFYLHQRRKVVKKPLKNFTSPIADNQIDKDVNNLEEKMDSVDQNFFEEEEINISEKSKVYRKKWRNQNWETEEEVEEYSKVTRKRKKRFKRTKGKNK